MTLDEAYALAQEPKRGQERPTVTATRNGATWKGKLVGVIPSPALVIETAEGLRIPLVLDRLSVAKTKTDRCGEDTDG